MKINFNLKIFLGIFLLTFLSSQRNILCNEKNEMNYENFENKHSINAENKDCDEEILIDRIYDEFYEVEALNKKRILTYYKILIEKFNAPKTDSIEDIKKFINESRCTQHKFDTLINHENHILNAERFLAKKKCFPYLYNNFKLELEKLPNFVKDEQILENYLLNAIGQYGRNSRDKKLTDSDLGQVLFSYNYLKELTKPNYEPTWTLEELLNFENFINEVLKNQIGFSEPNYAQKSQSDEAVNILFFENQLKNIKVKIYNLEISDVFEGLTGTLFCINKTCPNFISIASNRNFFAQKANLYHELGHVADRNDFNLFDEKFEHFYSGGFKNIIRNNINLNDLSSEMRKNFMVAWRIFILSQLFLQEYAKKSKNHFDQVNKILEQEKREFKADLFMLTNLFEKKDLRTILENLKNNNFLIKKNFDEILKQFPMLNMFVKIYNDDKSQVNFETVESVASEIEIKMIEDSYNPLVFYRIKSFLLKIGFLISKGIDINALLKTWESYSGKCFDVQDVYSPFWQDILKQTPKYIIDEQMKFAPEKFMMTNTRLK